eukprot:8775401-Pyramimonas_sp.AAC.1
MWRDAKARVADVQRVAAQNVALPQPSLEMLGAALTRFRHNVGLGNDCVNPRSWLLLSEDNRSRLLDILSLWENK